MGLQGFAILGRGATKTVAGLTSVQPVVDQCEDTTTETTDVGFTFAAGETEAASTKIWTPHAELPQGILMIVVSNESTTFFISLDVFLGYGLVIDYHYTHVYSHIFLLCAIGATRHLALEMMLSKSEQGQRPASSHALSNRAGANNQWHKRKERFRLNH